MYIITIHFILFTADVVFVNISTWICVNPADSLDDSVDGFDSAAPSSGASSTPSVQQLFGTPFSKVSNKGS